MRHDPSAIWAHLTKIIEYAISMISEINVIHFLSDSPSIQYRNKTMFQFMITYLKNFCKKSLTWNYYESGHGKGAPDGIGGTLKRTANRLVGEGKDIPDLKTFTNYLSKEVTNILLFVVTKSEIEEMDKLIATKNIPRFPGTMKVHQVIWRAILKRIA